MFGGLGKAFGGIGKGLAKVAGKAAGGGTVPISDDPRDGGITGTLGKRTGILGGMLNRLPSAADTVARLPVLGKRKLASRGAGRRTR